MNDFFVSVSADLPRLDPTHRVIDIEDRVFPRNNKVWAHGPMSLKFDGPFL